MLRGLPENDSICLVQQEGPGFDLKRTAATEWCWFVDEAQRFSTYSPHKSGSLRSQDRELHTIGFRFVMGARRRGPDIYL